MTNEKIIPIIDKIGTKTTRAMAALLPFNALKKIDDKNQDAKYSHGGRNKAEPCMP